MAGLFQRARGFWKTYEWELIVLLVVTVVALLSYGLGYTAAKESVRTPIIIEKYSDEQH